jgi:hypothetical protein
LVFESHVPLRIYLLLEKHISQCSAVRCIYTYHITHGVFNLHVYKYYQDKQQFNRRRNDKAQASRIDMIFIMTDFCSLVETCKIKPVTIQSSSAVRCIYTYHWKHCVFNLYVYKYHSTIFVRKLIHNFVIQWFIDNYTHPLYYDWCDS